MNNPLGPSYYMNTPSGPSYYATGDMFIDNFASLVNLSTCMSFLNIKVHHWTSSRWYEVN